MAKKQSYSNKKAGATKAPAYQKPKPKETFTKKQKVKFLKAGTGLGYGYLSGETAYLPIDEANNLIQKGIVTKE